MLLCMVFVRRERTAAFLRWPHQRHCQELGAADTEHWEMGGWEAGILSGQGPAERGGKGPGDACFFMCMVLKGP